MRKYVVLNKFGRVIGVADSIQDIADGIGIPHQTVHNKYMQGTPLQGKYLIMLRSKHEYLWHKFGGRRGGDDYFAFCTPEELRAYKDTEKRIFLDICDKYKPIRL